MPAVEQSGIRLTYSGAQEINFVDGKIELNAETSKFNINNQVWFAYRIDEGEWQRKKATLLSSTSIGRYVVRIPIAEGKHRLVYYGFLRRGPLTIPRWADASWPPASI